MLYVNIIYLLYINVTLCVAISNIHNYGTYVNLYLLPKQHVLFLFSQHKLLMQILGICQLSHQHHTCHHIAC